jgi:putative tricarboxylic transport membrane protein
VDALVQGFGALANPSVLFTIFVGVCLGMLVGAFPGVTITMAVAVASAFTLALSPLEGLSILLGIYMAALYGDRIPAILVNTPGTPGSIATTLDGFPLARQGKAGLALVISTLGSFFGALFGIALLAFFSFPLASIAIQFGSPELFALVVFALTMVVGISGGSLIKGLIGGLIGLALATIGLDPMVGVPRFTFGTLELQDGVQLLSILVGLFGITEVLDQVLTERRNQLDEIVTELGRWLPSRGEIKRLIRPTALGGGIGAFVGALPAAGGDIAGLISWDWAKRTSKRPEEFGKGSIEGLAAADTANNAAVGGALTTTLALGIPGDSVTAVLLGSMIIWGITPGPALFADDPQLIFSIIGILLLGNLLAFALSFVRVRSVVRLLDLPKSLLWTAILLFCLVGTFAVRNSMFDVWTTLGAGVVGLILRRVGIAPAPIVLGLLLGLLAESNLRRSLIASGGSLDVFYTNPIAMALFAASALSFAVPLVRYWRRNRSAEEERPV